MFHIRAYRVPSVVVSGRHLERKAPDTVRDNLNRLIIVLFVDELQSGRPIMERNVVEFGVPLPNFNV